MRTTIVWGVVLVCLTILIVGTGATAQRTRVIEAATTRTPSQVEVTNFPAVQAVSGTVNVGNLPAVQTVAGSVAVSNLPVDANGRLLVAAPRQEVHFLGYTTARYANGTAIPRLNEACTAALPGSRLCTISEFNLSLPTGTIDPADPCPLFGGLSGIVQVVRIYNEGASVGVVVDFNVGVADQCTSPNDPISPTYRAACCGY